MNDKVKPNLTAAQELRQNMIATWLHYENKWMQSSDIYKNFPELDKQKVYAQVSSMAEKGTLEKRHKKGGGKSDFEYKLRNPSRFLPPVMPAEFVGPPEPPKPAKQEKAAEPPKLAKPPVEPAGAGLPHKTPAEALIPKTPPFVQPAIPVQQVAEGVKGKRAKVFWRPEEQVAIAEEVAKLQVLQPHSKLITLLNTAQFNPDILPPERRRGEIHSLQGSAPWLEALLAKVKPRILAEIAEPEEAVKEIVKEPEPEPINLQNIPADAFIDEVVRRMSGTIGKLLVGVVNHVLTSSDLKSLLSPLISSSSFSLVDQKQLPQTQKHPQHNPFGVPLKQNAQKLEHVLVVGLLKSNHVTEIKDEFKNIFDLRFYHPDQHTSVLKSMAANVDKIILLTGQISHKHRETLEAIGADYVPLQGGVSKLKELLTNMYANS